MTIGVPLRLYLCAGKQTAFAGVATRKSAVILTIKSDRQLNSAHIHKSEQTSARRYHHEVKLTSAAEVNANC